MTKYKIACLLSMLTLANISYAEAPVVDGNEQFVLSEADTQSMGNSLSKAQALDNEESDEAIAFEEPLVPGNQLPDADNSMNEADLVDKIQQLQQELQELRGLLEVQAHDLKMLQQQQIAFYKDIDNRLRTGSNNESNNSSDNLSINSSEDKVKSNRDQTEEKSMDHRQPSSPRRTTLNPADEQISYLAAYDLIKNKHYDAGIAAMQKLLKQYPQGGYTANAHYWLGELYLVKNEPDKAIKQFEIVLDEFATSSKAAASLLKLAYALADNGQAEKARIRLREVIQKYPDTRTARLAAEKLEQLRHR